MTRLKDDRRARPTIKIKLPQKLYEHMSGSGFAAGDDYPEQRELFQKITHGTPLTVAEAEVVLNDGIESHLAALEAIAGSASDFEEGRDIAAAQRSALALKRRLSAFLEANARHEPEVLAVQDAIEQLDYIVRFVDYCENARTPGLLGQIAGVTDRELREVKVATRGRGPVALLETLRHELHHVQDPDWDCGNRDVLGSSGARGREKGPQ